MLFFEEKTEAKKIFLQKWELPVHRQREYVKI